MATSAPKAEDALTQLRQRAGTLGTDRCLSVVSAAVLAVLNRHRSHPGVRPPQCVACGLPAPCAERRVISAALANGISHLGTGDQQ